MAFLRFRLAYIIVAVFRSTALRRVVDGSLDRHRDRTGPSSSLHPGVNTVRPRPSGSGRSVLTPGPHRLLSSNQAPHLWCVAVKRRSDGPLRGRLTGRSTSSPDMGAPFGTYAARLSSRRSTDSPHSVSPGRASEAVSEDSKCGPAGFLRRT